MAVPATRALAVTYAAIVIGAVVLVQVFSGPTLVHSGAMGAAFLTTWTIAGLFLAAVPVVPATLAGRVSALASAVAGVALALGLGVNVTQYESADGAAALGAAMLLVTVAVRPRRPESPAASNPAPAEAAPHLWS